MEFRRVLFRSKIKNGDETTKQHFIQEVRRFYPFFPVVPARVRSDFVWEGHTFKRGTLTILDLYGTNHDPKTWTNPDVFAPNRFKDWRSEEHTSELQSRFDLVCRLLLEKKKR